MKNLLLELQVLINKATIDYQNRVWIRYDIYCTQFNKLLKMAVSNFKEINIAPIDNISSQAELNNRGKHEAYDLLAERIKLKDVIDRASTLLEKLSSYTTTSMLPITDASSDVELVCNNFCSVVRELRRRSDKGILLDIDTDGDMIYLLRSLLRLYFDAVFEDSWETKDKNEQKALLLHKEKIVLIVKKTSRSTADKDLLNDYIQALEYYSQEGEYSTLFYFIYDPELRISQPMYLENQLTLLNKSSLTTKIFIRPLT